MAFTELIRYHNSEKKSLGPRLREPCYVKQMCDPYRRGGVRCD